jgi:hypothetical protein
MLECQGIALAGNTKEHDMTEGRVCGSSLRPSMFS